MSILASQLAHDALSLSSSGSMIRKGGTLIVRPSGSRLGEGEATIICPEVKHAIDDMGSAFERIVIDLSEVRIMSSYGLGMCIELRNHARSRRAQVIVFGMCHDIRELFRIMKVDRLFTIAMTEQQLADLMGG